jgi:hypothetical protein
VDVHPKAAFAHRIVDAEVLAGALLRIGEYVAEHGMEGDGPYQPARDLLMRMSPRLGELPIQQEGERRRLMPRCGSPPCLWEAFSPFRVRLAQERRIQAPRWFAR